MTTLQPELESFRHELSGAIEADLTSPPRSPAPSQERSRPWASGGTGRVGPEPRPCVGSWKWSKPADAAILASAQRLSPRHRGSVFHVAATITVGSSTAQPYELWSAGSSYRFIKFGYEAAWNGMTMSSYDAASNTLYLGIYSPANHPPVDPAATTVLISWARCRSLARPWWTGSPPTCCRCRAFRQWARQRDLRPRQERLPPAARSGDRRVSTGTVCPETVHFQTYDYLPETPANFSLFDLSAQHPGATWSTQAASPVSGHLSVTTDRLHVRVDRNAGDGLPGSSQSRRSGAVQ